MAIIRYEEKCKTFECKKQKKLKEVQEYFSKLYDDEMAKFTNLEKSTFDDQKAEYRAWKADSNAGTPTVDTLAESRGIDREYLLNRIGEKLMLQVALTGQQQALEDKVEACETIECLEAIGIKV